MQSERTASSAAAHARSGATRHATRARGLRQAATRTGARTAGLLSILFEGAGTRSRGALALASLRWRAFPMY